MNYDTTISKTYHCLIDLPVFRFMSSRISAWHLTYEGRIWKIFYINNIPIVPTNAVYHNQRAMEGAAGCVEIEAYSVCPLEVYDLDLEPLEQADHWRSVDRGERPRAYTGMIARYGQKNAWVFLPAKFKIRPISNGEQISINF